MSLTHLKVNAIPYNGLFVCCYGSTVVVGKSVSGRHYLAQDLPPLPCGIYNESLWLAKNNYCIKFSPETPTPIYDGFLFLSENHISYKGQVYQLSWKRVSYDHAKFYCLDIIP